MTIWSRGTISPSLVQMYCCLSRALSFAWSMLKDTPADASAAAYSLIGIETSPKEMVPDAIGLALIGLGTDKCNMRPAIPAMPLEKYREKRSADTTPEPFGRGGENRPHLFVVQKHAATPAPLGFPPGVGRRPEVLGGSAGPLRRPRRQAPGGRGRGPPRRVRRLRGRDPGRQLRRRRGHRLGHGPLDSRSPISRRAWRRASCSSSSTATSSAAPGRSSA